MSELKIKTLLIDHLLEEREPNEFALVSELLFGDGASRADIAMFDVDGMSAFEIKGPRDNLDKLPYQVSSYESCFDYITIVCAPKHLETISSMVGSHIGISIVEQEQIKPFRLPEKNEAILAARLLSCLTKDEIVELAKKSKCESVQKSHSKFELIKSLENSIDPTTIRTDVHKILLNKHMPRFRSFLDERGRITHPDDLISLSRNYGSGELVVI